MSTRPEFSQRSAAQECGVSVETIKRRRIAGAFPNARKNDQGQWVIPVEDLLAAGFHPGKPTPADAPPDEADGPSIRELEATVAGLRGQLAEREDLVREVKAAKVAEVEAVRGHLLAIEQAQEATRQRIVDLTDRAEVARQEAEKARREAAEAEWTASAARNALTQAREKHETRQIVAYGFAAMCAAAAVVAFVLLFLRT